MTPEERIDQAMDFLAQLILNSKQEEHNSKFEEVEDEKQSGL